jgi:glycyl-tRNA synthetase
LESTVLTMQDALTRLSAYWAQQGCLTVQPMNTEVGAGTLNPGTALRVLGPEPWRVAYVEPSVRPDDARYGENPNRIQCHTQFQVILKPEPGNPQELYLGSLQALGIDITAHDVRFVEDNWASPALGAWGLGWEVWLDGLEITQFTYFQQAGLVLDPVSVEITYGMERILMALQGVRHFKDISYAPGVTYGEVFGQAEYEMSRYYLDDADVPTNRELLDAYATEARRMIDAGLPVPAHTFVLKMSHAFNVLDARGAVSTAERAAEFTRMRRLFNDVASLWVSTREKAGFPLGTLSPAPAATPAAMPGHVPGPQNVVFEVGVEEMPPAEAEAARHQLHTVLAEQLGRGRLAHGPVTVYATPRRLVAIIGDVADQEPDQDKIVRGPRVSAAYANGVPTKAAEGFARSNGVSVDALDRITADGVEYVAVRRHEPGRPAIEVLAETLGRAAAALRSAKNMRWNDPNLAFTRPVRWLTALYGKHVIPVTLSMLAAGRATRVNRTVEQPIIEIASADTYTQTLAAAGIVVDQATRRAAIVGQAQDLAATVGGVVDVDGEASLLDQIKHLVEQPTALIGSFDPSYLDLPETVLTTVMRKHQRYLPVRDGRGALMPHFVTIANGSIDTDAVRAGNEAVLRARFEDAAFFYRADQQVAPETMRAGLARLTFTDKLGSMLDHADRTATLALRLADDLPLTSDDRATLERAAQLVKFDLASQMVIELTSLAGSMASDYATSAGEPAPVAQALHEVELPRSAGDRLPETPAGALLAFAERMDAYIGLAATVGLPTGSSDPFAVRRAALGILTLARNSPVLRTVSMRHAAHLAAAQQPVPVEPAALGNALEFLTRRLEQQLLDEGQPVDRVRASLPHADQPRRLDQTLSQLATLAGDDTFQRVTAALQRARRIVPDATPAEYDPGLLSQPAEQQLIAAVTSLQDNLDAQADFGRFVEAAAQLIGPIEQFFTDVLVMDEDLKVRSSRLGLLAALEALGAPQLSWQELKQ